MTCVCWVIWPDHSSRAANAQLLWASEHCLLRWKNLWISWAIDQLFHFCKHRWSFQVLHQKKPTLLCNVSRIPDFSTLPWRKEEPAGTGQLYSFATAAATKYYRLDGLTKGNHCLMVMRTVISETQVLARLLHSAGCKESFCSMPFSLACWWPSSCSHCILPLCMSLCQISPSYVNTVILD